MLGTLLEIELVLMKEVELVKMMARMLAKRSGLQKVKVMEEMLGALLEIELALMKEVELVQMMAWMLATRSGY
jgi:TPP-dependent pyruvate/acetoin dehydrogenase alpha subunit